MKKSAKEFLEKFSTTNDAISAINAIIKELKSIDFNYDLEYSFKEQSLSKTVIPYYESILDELNEFEKENDSIGEFSNKVLESIANRRWTARGRTGDAPLVYANGFKEGFNEGIAVMMKNSFCAPKLAEALNSILAYQRMAGNDDVHITPLQINIHDYKVAEEAINAYNAYSKQLGIVKPKKKFTKEETISWMIDAYVMIGDVDDEGYDEGKNLLGALIDILKKENNKK